MEPVDFENLRTITDGDRVMETELFGVFINSSEECLSALRVASAVGDEAAWKKEAHAFKGICFNLGAGPLGELCKKAQEDFQAPAEKKSAMLEDIERELARVRQAIAGQ